MTAGAQVSTKWPQHSMDRPQPPIVNPGPFTASARPPSDAIVLFDGRSLENWVSADSTKAPARWKVAGGYVQVVARSGAIETKQASRSPRQRPKQRQRWYACLASASREAPSMSILTIATSRPCQRQASSPHPRTDRALRLQARRVPLRARDTRPARSRPSA